MQFAGIRSFCDVLKHSMVTVQLRVISTESPVATSVMAATVLTFLALLDTEQLLFMVVGAAGYLTFHTLQKDDTRKCRTPKALYFAATPKDHVGETLRRSTMQSKSSLKEFRPPTATSVVGRRTFPETSPRPSEHEKSSWRSQEATSRIPSECRSMSITQSLPAIKRRVPQSMPPMPPVKEKEEASQMRPASSITAPTFTSSGLEAEVPELLAQITPTAADEAAIGRIVQHVKDAISPIFPEAEVVCFASAKLTGSGAFGVAVPDVDLVVDVNPVVLLRRLQNATSDVTLDEHKLQKHVLRKCAGRLVERAGFKFRRSAFGGPDPRVTLLLPNSAGIFSEPIPLDLAVNSAWPFRASALLTECGAIDPRAKALILMVRRWAKDRGVSHVARGHLSPYAWSVLVIFFLQVGVNDVSILPPFSRFKAGGASNIPKRRGSSAASAVTVSQLFIEFFRFYAVKFDMQREPVSTRQAVRSPPDEQRKEIPAIEDPFEPGRNLAEGLQRAALERTYEEFARAHTMCSAKCSLTVLLEPWLPPEALVRGSRPASMEGDALATDM